MSKNLESVTLTILGKKYPLKLSEDERDIAKNIEKEINEKINNFLIKYKNVDEVDSLIMVLLSYAFDMHKKHSPNIEVEDRIEKMSQLIQQHIS